MKHKIGIVVSIVVVLGVIFVLGSYGQGYYVQPNLGGTDCIVFPINNPYAGEVQQAAQMLSSWNQTIGVPAQQAASNGMLPPGVNMNDGSAQLYQATLRSYQAQSNRDHQFAQRGFNMMDNPTPENVCTMNALGNMAAVGLSNAQMQGYQNALNARNTALNDFLQNTGRRFEYATRPVVSGPLQDEWDRCNRTILRFKNSYYKQDWDWK